MRLSWLRGRQAAALHLEVAIDPDSLFPETDEENNTASLTFGSQSFGFAGWVRTRAETPAVHRCFQCSFGNV